MSPQQVADELARRIREECTEYPYSLDVVVERFQRWLEEQE